MNREFSVRTPLFLGALALVALVGGFGGWAALSRISGAVIASGQVEVHQNRQAIQHPDGGTVSELLVGEGDIVAGDQVLLRLDPALVRGKLTIAEDQMHEIMARRGRLEAERDGAARPEYDPRLRDAAAEMPSVAEMIAGQTRLFQARAESTAGEIDRLRAQSRQIAVQIEGIEAQQEALDERRALIEEELENQQTLLDKKLAQASRVLAVQRQRAELQGLAGELTAQKAQALTRIAEIDITILSIGSRLREEAITQLRDLRVREWELAEEVTALRDRLGRMEIRAPVAGAVYDLAVFGKGAVIRPAEPLMYLVPRDRPAVIAARVAPINIDEVRVGQEVLLRLTSLSQRETPEIFGEVVKISGDAFVDEVSRQPYYRAEIVLRPGEVAKLPAGTALIPGMPVEAFLRTEARSPMVYLLKPLADYLARAMRES
ncbi:MULTISPECIES: HlyD family type I secretion periplasmic adaptor subunit [Marinovum]|uniref:HlyD family type I secretion periplasmic adaptor subunit n=1 Tax=Marinovum TaxID=367771 RepID=UPI00237BA087|nr:HlyD family type I secretion periplasmic adaptor subunit [Marinovum sp. PR37]MDD9744540.1 HlyD family type I secretion periplasmic adaptor subunit [Marinovum sp. PR37]